MLSANYLMVHLAVEPVVLEFESEHGWTPNQVWTHHQRATEVGLKLGGCSTEVVYSGSEQNYDPGDERT